MNFREDLKKTAPQPPQKNSQKTQQEKHKIQQQTKQAENCESVYWHTQVRVQMQAQRLSKKG